MLLISIRWARRDHPVILKRKICSKKHYLSRQVWKETAAVFGKEKGKSQRNERKDRKKKKYGGSYEIRGLLKGGQGEREPG